MSKPDLDIKIEEIKQLVTTLDYDMIDKGIALARELNEPAAFEELLKDCSIRNDSEWDYGIVPGGLFVDTKKDASYLYYALLNLIGYVPKACNVDNRTIFLL